MKQHLLKPVLLIMAILCSLSMYASCTKDATEKYYIVSFETNGGNAIEDVKVAKNKPLPKPADPIKKEHKFVAWHTNKELTSPWKFYSSVSENMTLYAEWIAFDGSSSSNSGTGKITFLYEKKVTDEGLYLDGEKRTMHDLVTNTPGFEYAFGRRITPHGDCIKKLGDFLFLTWWWGGEEHRKVMLSRLHIPTQTIETIEFDHTHVGYRYTPHIGDSHNTIAVGVCPQDSTVHLLYDMHSSSQAEHPNTFFNYQCSVVGAATAEVGSFKKELFNPHQTYLNPNENYSDTTYPSFFLNDEGALFVWGRLGGNSNGGYRFAKYTGDEGWGMYTYFSGENAKEHGCDYNWGAYGSMQYSNGKFRIGFVKRMSVNDKYINNNGFHYAYSDDPTGETMWHNYAGESFDTPLYTPEKIMFYEPGDVVSTGNDDYNTINITTAPEYTVTDAEAVHFIVNSVRNTSTGQSKNVHAYRKAGERNFTVATDDFPGGSLHAVSGNRLFLISETDDDRIKVYRAEGGTNNWEPVYISTEGIKLLHYNVLIEKGQMYIYAMQEGGSGDARPIYIQVYDLGL